MRVLLIAPKAKESYYSKVSKWDEIGLGLLYLASSLKNSGFTVKVELTDEREVQKNLDGCRPSAVGITSVTATYNKAIKILEAVKSYDPSIITIIGGHHVTFTVDETLGESCVDYVIRGEGEEVLPRLLYNITKGKPFELINGVCFKKGNNIFNNNSLASVKNINTLPFPDRGAVKKYKFPEIYIFSSRGCPFKCNFCSSTNFYGGALRKRSVYNVLNELEEIKNIRKNKVVVKFGDETLTADSRWTKELCRGIIKRGLKFKWYSNSRVDSIDRNPELLKLMKEAGCRGLALGIESGIQEIINSYNKGITLDQALRVAKKLRDYSIYQQWYFMIGSGDKYDEIKYIKKSVEFMKIFPFDLLQISILTPFPGTKLYKQLEKENRIINRNWDYYDGLHCVYKPLGMKAEQMEKELTNAYREIYIKSGIKNIFNRVYRFKHSLANSRSFLAYLNLVIRVGILKQDLYTALEK